MRTKLTASLLGGTLIAALGAAGCGASASGSAQAQTTGAAAASVTATESAGATATAAAPCKATVGLTEGPYWKAGSPRRTRLRDAGVSGKALKLTGAVVDATCKPITGATLDFWQADGKGHYDNAGFRLRGHQTTDSAGRFTLDTVVPGLYPGRTEHIHVKVTPPGGKELTTQLFFPGVTSNGGDGIFVASMLVRGFHKTSSGYRATFRFEVAR